jgi:hypothetical protein
MTNETDRLREGRAVIERTYRAIWNDWFERMRVPRADFCVTYDCADSGYRPKKDELHLSLPELNVEEASDDLRTNHNTGPPPGVGWPAWKRELIHEVLHEYQHKVVAGQASPKGMQLEANHPGCFEGVGHGADFFTAIAEKASYFGISPEDLISNL